MYMPTSGNLPARAIVFLVIAALAYLFCGPGCAPEATPSGVMGLDAWVVGEGSGGTLAGNTNTVEDNDGGSAPVPSPLASTGTSIIQPKSGSVAGAVGGAPGSDGSAPLLYVNKSELRFGLETLKGDFTIANIGGGKAAYAISADAAWAGIDPSEGTSAGETDMIEVSVNPVGLSPGQHTAQIEVAAAGGASHLIAISLEVPEGDPVLAVSGAALSFGAQSERRTLTVSNTGGGSLGYTVETSAAWLTASPSSGDLAAEADVIEVAVDRYPLVVGPHEAYVTVRSSAGDAHVIWVGLEKAPVEPLVVPWIETNIADEAQIASTVEGLKVWHRITDTAIVSTEPNHAHLYTRLREQVPDIKIIPGLKTSPRLGPEVFDSVANWQLVANDVAAIIATSGATSIAMENEVAQQAFLRGDYVVDWDRFRQCLALLPPDVEYIWYPSQSPWDEEYQLRTQQLCQAVEDVLDCRFVELTYGRPSRVDHPLCWLARERLDAIAEVTPTPIVWFGGSYWSYEQLPTVVEWTDERPYVIYYPVYGHYHWASSGEAIIEQFALLGYP